VTTNAAGRAVASELQAIGRGALRIQVQASYQGQVATATVSQTNVATAADAARLARPNASAGGAGASTASTVAGVAAAAAGGVLAIGDARGASCTSQSDRAKSDLNATADACSAGTSQSCLTTATRAAASLGEWCSCAGRAEVDTALAAEGTSFAGLSQFAGLGSVAFPGSCR
jgi:hypothetical protein